MLFGGKIQKNKIEKYSRVQKVSLALKTLGAHGTHPPMQMANDNMSHEMDAKGFESSKVYAIGSYKYICVYVTYMIYIYMCTYKYTNLYLEK